MIIQAGYSISYDCPQQCLSLLETVTTQVLLWCSNALALC